MGADGAREPWFSYIHQLVPSIAATSHFYSERMGMRPTDDGRPGAPLTLGDGQGGYGLRLVLAERPQNGWQADWLARHGPGIDHVGYAVESPDDCLPALEAAGARVIERAAGRRIVFQDPTGAHVVLFEAGGRARPKSAPVTAPALHHAAIVGSTLADLSAFYATTLGLTNAYQHGEAGGGFAFLADSGVMATPGREGPILEIVGPPGLWTLETDHLDRHGPGLYHLCFAVPDVDGAYAELRAKGHAFVIEPLDNDSNNRLAFFRDPNGIVIELMLPVRRVHRGETP
jgi:catechol 2,3-dioxygenase-like lactoylglutathione lyase family enzyme